MSRNNNRAGSGLRNFSAGNLPPLEEVEHDHDDDISRSGRSASSNTAHEKLKATRTEEFPFRFAEDGGEDASSKTSFSSYSQPLAGGGGLARPRKSKAEDVPFRLAEDGGGDASSKHSSSSYPQPGLARPRRSKARGLPKPSPFSGGNRESSSGSASINPSSIFSDVSSSGSMYKSSGFLSRSSNIFSVNQAFQRGSTAIRSSMISRSSFISSASLAQQPKALSNRSILANLKNKNLKNAFAKRTSLARRNKTTELYMARMMAAKVYREYSIGDYALIMCERFNSSRLPSIDDAESSSLSFQEYLEQEDPMEIPDHCLVNKYGYLRGKGGTLEERKGPYSYMLCSITKVHYEENMVYWTVTREHDDAEMRGDARHMEPILTEESLLAAQEAASMARSHFEDMMEVGEEEQFEQKNGFWILLSTVCCITCCFPLFLLYVFQGMIKNSEWFEKLLRHAKMFLHGKEPYYVSCNITSVNVIVVCSIWYLFADQFRLAFLPPEADEPLAYVNFTVWLILVLELIFGVFARPAGWCSLVRSDKAYTPQTARYISGIHVFVEALSLVFFVPVFYCIFSDEVSCSDRLPYSLFEASLAAVVGPSLGRAFYGRLCYGLVRLRVFALVRHWRNFWLNSTFLNYRRIQSRRERRRRALLFGTTRDDDMSTSTMDTAEEFSERKISRQHLVPYGQSGYTHPREILALKKREEQKQEEARVKASNIGTALMTVNSHRALLLFCFLTAVFPMLMLFNMQNVVNPVGEGMVEYLQAINFQDANNYTGEDSSIDCDYLFDSVEAWSLSMLQRDPLRYISQRRERTPADPSSFLIGVSIRPPRCNDYFANKTIGDLTFHVDDNCPPWSWPDDRYTGACIYGTLFNMTEDSLDGVAQNLSLRVGSMKTLQSYSGTGESVFAVSATYNYTHVVQYGAQFSFILELLLLVIIIVILQVLRHATVDLVLLSLRSMLRIVLRYAKNPLAPPGKLEVQRQQAMAKSTVSSDSGYDDSVIEDEDDEIFQTYETEQLVTAVSKITDLLRKCWGVAGANIISTNLASRDGKFEVFNPTVPGRNVFALFAFAAICDFDYALKSLSGDVMILINDVASVLHGEVYRWGLGDSGQCNRNLGGAFFMVFKIGSVLDVVEKLEEATRVVFSTASGRKETRERKKTTALLPPEEIARHWAEIAPLSPVHNDHYLQLIKDGPMNVEGLRSELDAEKRVAMEAMAEAMKLPLQQIPGISTFADRAVIGMLKAYASIHRNTELRAWSKDFRLSGGEKLNREKIDELKSLQTWSVNMIFGMDAGWAVEGAVGSEYKIDATYLSPHVNMSSRMMSACKQYGVTILLSEAVQELLSEPGKAKMRNIDRVTVKGSSKIQNIYTYDARSKGTYLFLYEVSDEKADQQAKNYDPNIWNTDMDLKDMRHHITEDFEQEFKAGMKAYYDGDWPTAIAKLEHANNIMVETAMDEGDLRDSMSTHTSARKILYREETSDPPSMYLINFMKSKGGQAPDDWDGWHPLMSK